MNKQLLCFVALCASSTLCARQAEPSREFMDFNNLEKNHKRDWFNFMKSEADHRTDMLKKQHDDWADFRNHHISQMMSEDLSTQEAKEAALAKNLRSAINLHKKHVKTWETFAESRYAQGKKICERHKQQLAQFEEQLDY